MAALSGKNGEVLIGACSLLELMSWDLEQGVEIQEYASKAGAGNMQTVAGVASGTGTIEINFDPDDPPEAQFSTGDLVSLTLRHTTTNSVQGTGSARLGKFSYNANRDGTIETVSIPFTCHGAWTPPS